MEDQDLIFLNRHEDGLKTWAKIQKIWKRNELQINAEDGLRQF